MIIVEKLLPVLVKTLVQPKRIRGLQKLWKYRYIRK